MTPSLLRNKVKRPSEGLAPDRVLDQVIEAILDEKGARGGQKAKNRYWRLLKEQERLLARFQPRNSAPVSTYSERPHGNDQSDNQEAHTSKKTKFTESLSHKNEAQPSTSKRSRPADNSSIDHLDTKSESGAPPAKRPRAATEENSAGNQTKGENSDDFNSRPEHSEAKILLARKEPMGPSQAPARSKAVAPRGNIKKGRWADDEEQVLINLMIAQREWEIANNVPPKKWLKDVRLYEKMSRQLAEVGIERSSAACKNQWNRSAREKSGFDERPDNGTTRSLVCSEQKPKKDK